MKIHEGNFLNISKDLITNLLTFSKSYFVVIPLENTARDFIIVDHPFMTHELVSHPNWTEYFYRTIHAVQNLTKWKHSIML